MKIEKNIYPIEEKRAAVMVKRINDRSCRFRIIPGSICCIEKGTLMAERPEFQIIDDDGDKVEPAGKFLWTAETIDPFHLVIDI